MKTFIFLCLLGLPAYSAPKLTEEARAFLDGYAVQDQHDVLALTLQDVIADLATEKMDTPLKKDRLAKLEKAALSGSIPEYEIKKLRWEIAADDIREEGLAFRVQAIQKKLASIEALGSGDLQNFLNGDLESNTFQLRYFEKELAEAELAVTYWVARHDNLTKLAQIGSSPWAQVRAALREKLASEIQVTKWKAKIAEQERQLEASKVELTKSRSAISH